jgi:hypothetical protein
LLPIWCDRGKQNASSKEANSFHAEAKLLLHKGANSEANAICFQLHPRKQLFSLGGEQKLVLIVLIDLYLHYLLFGLFLKRSSIKHIRECLGGVLMGGVGQGFRKH